MNAYAGRTVLVTGASGIVAHGWSAASLTRAPWWSRWCAMTTHTQSSCAVGTSAE